MANKFSRLPQPPAPLFINKKERDFQKQVSNELIERVIGQEILYFPLDITNSNYHDLYGEAIQKSYLPSIHIYVLIEWHDFSTETSQYGIDRTSSITLHFHHRRLTEDQDLQVQEGDIIQFDHDYFEISEIYEPSLLFGNTEFRTEISCKAHKIRQDFFQGER